MKNRYPFLAVWKSRGFRDVPPIPTAVIKQRYKRNFEQYLLEHGKSSLGHIVTKDQPDETEKKIKRVFDDQVDKDAIEWMCEVAEKILEYENFIYGSAVRKAIERILAGHDREEVLRELGNTVLPDTKGGRHRFTEDQKRTLKAIYLELQDCIREIRRKLDVPLRDTGEYSWGKEDKTEDIKEFFPDIADIFKEEELEKLTEEPSIAKTALGIITKRLRPILSSISTRTLRNILDNIPSLFSLD